jgi:hypothetical protein
MAKTQSGFLMLLSSHVIATVTLVVVLMHHNIWWLPIPFCLILPTFYLCEIRRKARLHKPRVSNFSSA